MNKKEELKELLIEKEANKVYGKFGKNVVNKVVRFIMSFPKTPAVNSNRVINYIKMSRELSQQKPLPLNKKRVVPPKPKVVRKPKQQVVKKKNRYPKKIR